ncbi:MAG: DUF1080 domain-containing protein [Verrucomicrobiota bacterium]
MKHPVAVAVGLALALVGCASKESSTPPAAGSTGVAGSSGTAGAVNSGAPGSRLGKVDAEGFTVIFDGTWDGWRVNENPKAWTIVDRAFRACGDRSHNFYVGKEMPFKDFELKVDVLTEPGSNGGIYIHTKFQDTGWPWGGYETQVNQTQGDWRKSGSVYAVQDVKEDVLKGVVQDNQWYTHHVVVKGGNLKIFLNGKLVNDFTEEPGRQPGKDFERKLNQGTVAFQAHDPKSVVYYRNVRIKRL